MAQGYFPPLIVRQCQKEGFVLIRLSLINDILAPKALLRECVDVSVACMAKCFVCMCDVQGRRIV